MEKLFQLILGVVLALLFIWFARTRGPQREPFIYSIGLIIAALFYVAFSVTGATTQWFMLELIGLVVFTIFAVLGLRVSLWFLALGWASHLSGRFSGRGALAVTGQLGRQTEFDQLGGFLHDDGRAGGDELTDDDVLLEAH